MARGGQDSKEETRRVRGCSHEEGWRTASIGTEGTAGPKVPKAEKSPRDCVEVGWREEGKEMRSSRRQAPGAPGEERALHSA